MNLDPHAAEQILAKVFRQHIAAPERLTVSQWADKYRYLADKSAVRKGPWVTDYSPHLRDVMDAFSDPVVRHISIMKPTQCGGTESVINMVLYAIDCSPGDMFWVWANKENAEEFGQERLMPNIKACDRTSGYVSGAKHDETKRNIILSHMTIRFRGAPIHMKAEQNLESWPAKYIANDELDRCAPDTPDIMASRVSAYPTTSKRIDLGSPGAEDQGIDAQVRQAAGGGLYFWVPCPHCGVYFVRNFEMVHWEGGGKAKWEHVKETAWLRCPTCDGKLEGHQNRTLMQKGKWAPDWDETRPIAQNPLPSQARIDECLHANHVGFRIGEFSDPFALNCYGDVAAKFVQNHCQPTEPWTTRMRGRPWSVRGERVQESELKKLCIPIELGGYRMSTVPPGVLYLETAIDVQHKEAWVRVRGWGRLGGESWLVHTERVPILGGDLRALDKCVGWRFPLAKNWCDHNGEAPERVDWQTPTMRSCLTCVDSGNTNDDIDVYSWVLRHGGAKRNVFAVKGQPGTANQSSRSQWKTELTSLPSGKPVPGGGLLVLVNVNTMHWKKWVLSRVNEKATVESDLGGDIDAISDDEDAQIATNDRGLIGYCVWRFPESTYEPGRPDEQTSAWQLDRYFRQLMSEEFVEVEKNGKKVRRWMLRAGSGRQNHFFDAECYGAACVALRSRWGSDLTRAFGVSTNDSKPILSRSEESKPIPEPATLPQAAQNVGKPKMRPVPQPGFLRHLRG